MFTKHPTNRAAVSKLNRCGPCCNCLYISVTAGNLMFNIIPSIVRTDRQTDRHQDRQTARQTKSR